MLGWRWSIVYDAGPHPELSLNTSSNAARHKLTHISLDLLSQKPNATWSSLSCYIIILKWFTSSWWRHTHNSDHTLTQQSRKQHTFTQCWFNVGPSSMSSTTIETTLGKRLIPIKLSPNVVSMLGDDIDDGPTLNQHWVNVYTCIGQRPPVKHIPLVRAQTNVGLMVGRRWVTNEKCS